MIVGHRAFSNSFLVFILTITFAVGTLVLAIGVQAEAPTKQQIAFYSNRDENFEIYVMDVDGKNPQRSAILILELRTYGAKSVLSCFRMKSSN